MIPVKRICVFEHSVLTNFNCACPAIQRGQGSGFLSEGSSWLTACMSEQRMSWRGFADAQLAWTFAARIGDKYQICLTRSKYSYSYCRDCSKGRICKPGTPHRVGIYTWGRQSGGWTLPKGKILYSSIPHRVGIYTCGRQSRRWTAIPAGAEFPTGI